MRDPHQESDHGIMQKTESLILYYGVDLALIISIFKSYSDNLPYEKVGKNEPV